MMHRFARLSLIGLVLSSGSLAGTALAQGDLGATHASHVMVAPDDIRWESCPAVIPPGARCAVIDGDLTKAGQLFAFRIKFPDGFEIPAHFHPADEHLVVLAGTFHLGFGDKLDRAATRGMPAGSFMVMPKGHHHFAFTEGETILQVYAVGPWGLTYVNPADDPRNAK